MTATTFYTVISTTSSDATALIDHAVDNGADYLDSNGKHVTLGMPAFETSAQTHSEMRVAARDHATRVLKGAQHGIIEPLNITLPDGTVIEFS